MKILGGERGIIFFKLLITIKNKLTNVNHI